MPSYTTYGSPSPPHNRRNHSPVKSSPLRHTLSTRSNESDTDHSSIPSRQGTISSNASSGYSNGSYSGYSGYESTSDPFVENRRPVTGAKRERSESPVKKNAAFAAWEQREQAAERHRPSEQPSHKRAQTMDVSPRKIQDDDWRSGIGRSESRAALRPVASNVQPDVVPDMSPSSTFPTCSSPSRKENDDALRYRPPSTNAIEPPSKPTHHARGRSVDGLLPLEDDRTRSSSPIAPSSKNNLATLTRSDSMRASTRPRREGHVRFSSTTDITAPQLDGEDLAQLEKSSTPQFRHLSQMASEEGSEEFGIHSKEEQVVGLAGRRRLQRSGSTRSRSKNQSSFSSQFASTRWMDTQRKHLQAYEYLCHIGEARGWLQDVLEPTELPPIVQLEEALRDGVTLAEVVVRLASSLPPEQQADLGSLRIFRSSRLQFRHSDNIALFFRFLAQIELPELFRFELVDLYEKKNIPKVIYCIHALSWLLYRKGIVEFRIGNLVGQLQFEEHELEETQKGIDRSGVQMPNFGGMREAMQIEEPEPEPEPTPEELLAEQEDLIVDLQSQIRGALMRLRLGDMMQDLWDAEESIAYLQGIIRGGFAREIFSFKYNMDLSTRRVQAAANGFLLRRRQLHKQRAWSNNEPAIVKVQSLWRAKKDRAETQKIKNQLQKHAHGVRELQAAVRGALGRWRAGDLWHETREPEVEDKVAYLQGAIRAFQLRTKLASQKMAARESAVDIVRLQAVARGLIQRKEHRTAHGRFQQHQDAVIDLQSAARGLLARLKKARTIGALQGRELGIVRFQAVTKGSQMRQEHVQLKQKLRQEHANVKTLQSCARAMLQRQSIGKQFAALERQENKITSLQALGRAYIERQRIFEQLVEMEKEDESISRLQGFARAMLTRSNVGDILSALEDHEPAIVDFQAACRAFVVRSHFAEKKRHYNENMQKVIKLQSFVRAKQQGESYKSLVSGKNPPLPVVRRHLHLLTDTTLEFESELEAERLRRQVVESVRRNELVEGYVEGLDVKIALLVKNKITLDEVVKHQKHFGGSASQLLRNGAVIPGAGGLDLKALNKNSRKKLSGYEELFFMLQTQPAYLARLFHQLTAKGLAEKDAKNLERLTMTLFGYAQKSREEYCLLKILSSSMQKTVSQSQNLDDYMRQQNAAFYQKVLSSYIRSPRDRSYLKSLFGSMVRDGICGQDYLDLESDPLQIYRAILNNEELSTGHPSDRQRDLPREVVIREPDVRPKYVEHLQDLRDLCDSFFLSLEETLHRMPYGVRYLATENYRALCEHFPREDPAHLALQSGSWLWKTFLLPALKEPEMWGVIDRGLSPVHKRNLGQVVTVLSQVAAGRLFSSENLYLQPLNNWISESLDRWQECLTHVFDVSSVDEHFDADQFSDLYSRTKPTLYIKLADIFALHSVVSENLSVVASGRDDPIKELLADLGTAKSNETDLSGAVSGGEITLTLKSRFTVQEDPNSEARALFTATKRLVLYVIKVQSGSSLMEILLRPISHEDADRWIQLVREEIAEQDSKRPKRQNSIFDPRGSLRGARTQSVYSEAPSAYSEDRRDLLDLQSMTYAELKSSALENILALEQPSVPPHFRVSRHNNYQEILNALAADIRQKHRRRLERQREIESTRATLAQLDDKANFLEDQLKSYNDYIEQCLHTLANKKSGKPRFLLPFTKQWNHERELERAGRQPKFGSYKYSARQLADKGVLLQWPGYPAEHWGQLNVVISSDDVGVFHLEGSSGSMMLPGASANLLLDDLLQAQYDNKNSITVFEETGGGAKLAVNLLLHLVFKKFYKDG